LITPDELDRKLAILGTVKTSGVLALSTLTGRGLSAFEQTLRPGRAISLIPELINSSCCLKEGEAPAPSVEMGLSIQGLNPPHRFGVIHLPELALPS
jgi:hypothetical protein